MTTKKTAKTKTMRVERNRLHYAQSFDGDSSLVRVDEPLGIDLELPASYAQDLLAALKRAIAATDDFENAEISVDVPVRLYLQPIQVEQLIERLAEIS